MACAATLLYSANASAGNSSKPWVQDRHGSTAWRNHSGFLTPPSIRLPILWTPSCPCWLLECVDERTGCCASQGTVAARHPSSAAAVVVAAGTGLVGTGGVDRRGDRPGFLVVAAPTASPRRGVAGAGRSGSRAGV